VHRAGEPSSAMVALLVGPVRGFASVYHSGDGLAGSGRATSRECAHVVISKLCRGESTYAVIRAQGLVFSLLRL
jgi:hypothetical protein